MSGGIGLGDPAAPSRAIRLYRTEKVALVDADDYESLWRLPWRLSQYGYAVRGFTADGHRKFSFMHREIMSAPKGLFCDHINGDRLDNRRCNLRLVTPRENAFNKGISRRNTSGFKGVSFDQETGKYRAAIKVSNRSIALGFFPTAEEAAVARVAAERQYFGEHARAPHHQFNAVQHTGKRS